MNFNEIVVGTYPTYEEASRVADMKRGFWALEDEFPYTMKAFWEAFDEGRDFQSHRQRWRGYDMSVWVNNVNGDICAGLNMEYLNCGNGYYYMLINREKFIGIDID